MMIWKMLIDSALVKLIKLLLKLMRPIIMINQIRRIPNINLENIESLSKNRRAMVIKKLKEKLEKELIQILKIQVMTELICLENLREDIDPTLTQNLIQNQVMMKSEDNLER